MKLRCLIVFCVITANVYSGWELMLSGIDHRHDRSTGSTSDEYTFSYSELGSGFDKLNDSNSHETHSNWYRSERDQIVLLEPGKPCFFRAAVVE